MQDFLSLADLGICQRCLGRIFASVGESLDNRERGRMLLFSLRAISPELNPNIPEETNCPLCQGILADFDRYFGIVEEELGEVEYSTFLIGSIFEQPLIDGEKAIQEKYGSRGESIKKEFNREFGKYFQSKTGKEVDFDQPDITLTLNTIYDYARVEIRSIFIRGRYNKLRRDLPQTRWIHKPGNDESVESFIGRGILPFTGGDNYFLHAAGREDVDVRMLGKGRDFVIEITSPSRRNIELPAIEENINSRDNGVKVSGLEICSRESVKEVKGSTFDKTYRVSVTSSSEISENRLKSALGSISGKVIYQRTPLRVAARRADLVRQRTIRESVLEEVVGKNATILLRAESGTYIKELVNGDNGRTNPSLAAVYGESLEVSALDVVEINRGD